MPTNKDIPAPEISVPPTEVDVPISQNWPTKAGAIEYRPDFQKEMGKAYGAAWAAGDNAEAFFYVKGDGSLSPISVAPDEGSVKTTIPADARMIVHTHPYPQHSGAKPSDYDEAEAKSLNIPIVTLSTGGMYETGSDGKTFTVAPNTDWMSVKRYIKTAEEPESKSSPDIKWDNKKK